MTDSKLVAANTRFALKLYREIVARESGRNVFISPASVALALAMVYNGASGETGRAMAEALELGGLSLEDVNRANAELARGLRSLGPEPRLALANSLWARQGVALDPGFLRRSQDAYEAAVETLDFADPRAADTINAWVGQHTEGKIQQIIDQIDPAAVLFVINAIYFKGSWASKFDQRRTSAGQFRLPGGRQVPCQMMTQSGEFGYYEGAAFQAIRLPYRGGRLSMYLFLPSEQSDLGAFHRALDSQSWEAWLRRFAEGEGSITMPRFRLAYEATLNQALGALGMAVAFDRQRADFAAMCPDTRVNINEVKHKTFVEVNEEGTEAAAVTSVEITLTAFMPKRTFSMVVDRPFFCAIRDDRSGTVLFMGAIVEPTSL